MTGVSGSRSQGRPDDRGILGRPLEAVPRAAAGGHAVVRLADGRSGGRLADVRPARVGLLRVALVLACPGGVVAASDLRALVTADILQRTVEAEGLQLFHVLAGPALAPEQAKVLNRAITALGVHPPLDSAPLGGAPDVHVIADGADVQDLTTAGVQVRVGAVSGALDGADSAGDAGGLANGDTDPSALRLALLTQPYAQPITLTRAVLADAEQTVLRWRHRVAEWARSPSQPVPPELQRQAQAAFTRDLDSPAVLALLAQVEATADLADGARFETFASIDRVLALELTRSIGSV
ncbi:MULTISPECIES: hypothetical protein [unclassified Kitasatospora]|uniref:hypothetical protein n=1 Tax=unclassified Kitasatospora TaxID=2633591 RepID=UPI00247502A1|nr:hypothetical protein [Kitasatospora sp. MAP12-44]